VGGGGGDLAMLYVAIWMLFSTSETRKFVENHQSISPAKFPSMQ